MPAPLLNQKLSELLLMKMLRRNRHLLGVLFILLLFIFVFSRCVDKQEKEVIINKEGQQFAGAEACKSCHKDVYESFLKTAHHFTSQPANEKTIKEASGTDKPSYSFNYLSRVNIENRGDSFYQVEYYKGEERSIHRMDITIGSGTRGQSYLSWNENNLYQLPVSYFASAHAWANSPGFPEGNPKFNRVVYTRCLECHTTYSDYNSGRKEAQAAEKPKILYGVSCEKCHGPAQKHADFHTNNPAAKKAEFIINPASFTRVQSLDMCALCHAGKKTPVKPTFSFAAGDTLDHFFAPSDTVAEGIDVHVNQSGLLARSKCFTNSKTLTCTTCHNTHNQERGNAALFSQRCMSCHTQEQCHYCAVNPSSMAVTSRNCIDCHMPVQASKMLTVELEKKEKKSPAKIRSHLIGIYPEETAKMMKYLQN